MATWDMWLPPDLPAAVLASLTERFCQEDDPDPHEAAAIAWEWIAATQPPTGGEVQSVSTGAQSITYATGGSGTDAASRARWHRHKMRAKTVQVGPDHGFRTRLGIFPTDSEDRGVIATYPSPSRPPS
jgi:hypothetical protein